ncbi:MAG: ATP-dependent sacrificial sulfur transferase LarE [Proteobacteria bacterium]|nr:ATP-dependent sacrificial sulfur transferase LarE [Pseudomonadota bacterium]
MGRLLVALSGGVDSAALLCLAARTAEHVEAATVDSPLTPRRDLTDAEAIVRLAGVRWHRLRLDERTEADVRLNPPDRCYRCKRLRFGRLVDLAVAKGLGAVVDGANADDSADDRPGMRAAAELGVRSPLLEAGLTKADLRQIARDLGLPVADKPAAACLATRMEVGVELDSALLRRIDRAEAFLQDLGLGLVRCRVRGKAAVIEVEPTQIARLTEDQTRQRVVAKLTELGFDPVTVSLRGYGGFIG